MKQRPPGERNNSVLADRDRGDNQQEIGESGYEQ